ncbi:uncharacterized protein NDAI_0D00600 [Naumovozyma dairenensis CBS 421]|uniref:NADP-dependent oxidoreductase domain-containing protein n=1 Tax=Naumovozyma dairenensis (strain ATCC 10597 / BCRC 20456 / CBS 421 / NBRC 0211 / NRRL Y-12639) TaxID=1071378 RepID=G0W9B3_NAUDC|nr:hypothetical protein NDAI_0D00600 [Naumovozyma dairenensis CBS 421]CCD24374.1 hypothetical protein NDAI_0D00600 [Naumovozyma dairenensis CBS 421]
MTKLVEQVQSHHNCWLHVIWFQKLGLNGLKMTRKKFFQILKHCYDIGFRTFDTADVYSNGESERLLGEFLKEFNIKKGNSGYLLTKTYFPMDETLVLAMVEAPQSESGVLDLVNQQGLSRKHILQAVKNSVERLGTYIDVLQIHRFDSTTPIKGTMKALNDVVENGDVRYIGASSMLPTQFVEMQAVADKYDWFQFVNVQSQYNLLYRKDERDCKKHNIALTPWSPNYQSLLTISVGVESIRSKTDKSSLIEICKIWMLQHKEIINRVEDLSKKKGAPMATIPTAWVMAMVCQSIVGRSSVKRVDEAREALKIKFTEEELAYLEKTL